MSILTTRRLALALLASLAACEGRGKLEGPTPSLSALSPQAVCREQLVTEVTLTGSGLAPLVSDSLTAQPKVNLPSVALIQAQSIDGRPGSGETLRVDDDPTDPAASRVKWMSQESMAFQVYPELAASAGLYTVAVATAPPKPGMEAKLAELAESLLVMPRPTLTSVTADVVCSDQPNTVTLEGDFFVKAGTETPKVSFDSTVLSPLAMEECRRLPGPTGLEACRRLKVAIPEKGLAPGARKVKVTNPPTVSCASTEEVLLTLVPEPTLAKVEPDLVCTAEGDNRLTVSGTGFVTIDGRTPTLFLGDLPLATTAEGCTQVSGPKEAVRSCTTLRATLAKRAALAPGSYGVSVKNPATADCRTRQPVKFTVVPPPSVSSVQPDLACTAEGDRGLTINGTGFLTVDGRVPQVKLGSLTLTPTASGCTPVTGPTETVASCTSLQVTVPKDTPAATLPVTVTNPAPAGCSSVEPVNFFVVPPPKVTSVVPELACTAQGDVALTINGQDFLTIAGTLPVVRAGSLTLVPTPSGCVPYPAPSPTESVQICNRLAVTVPQGTATGSLAVSVTNPQPAGCSSSQAFSLVVVPPPSLSSIAPDLLCLAQGANTVVATGTGFLRIGNDTPQLVIGTASYSTTLSNCAPVAGTTNAESCTTASATVGQTTLAAGVQSAKLVNPAPADCQSTEAITVAVAPPPSVSSLTPDLLCLAEGAVSVTIAGSGFLKLGATLPSVTVAGQPPIAASSAGGCTALTGTTSGAESCTSLAVSLPQSVASGELGLTVTNPAPAGCSSASKKMFLAGPPRLSAIIPPGVCETATAPVTIELQGQELLEIGGATPQVTIGTRSYTSAMVASSCAAVSGYSQSLSRCGAISITVNPGDLPGGSHPTTVKNPTPAGCSTPQSMPFNVVPRPTLSAVTPAKLCAGGGTVDLSGTNFAPGMIVRLLDPPNPPVQASSVTVLGPDSAKATFAGPLPVGGPFDLEIVTAGGGCDARLAGALTVTNGPVVFFVDPPVIYNQITTQATVYASGFAASGLTVKIRPSGGSERVVPSVYDPLKANRILFTLAPADISATGSYDVLVVDANTTSCPGELIDAFQVVSQTTLTLKAITPPFGYTGAETAVEVTADPLAGGGLKALPRIYLSAGAGGGTAVALESVTVIDSGRASAVVPRGLQVGSYTLIAVNPDGGVGVLAGAFRVLADPVPVIDSVTPASLVTGQAAAPLVVSGANFRTPAVELRCRDAAGTESTHTATVTASTDKQIGATVNTSAMANGLVCVLRETNSDGSYADFSAVVTTNPAQNLTPFKPGPAMTTARRALVAQAGFVTRAAQFLYALGGDSGSAASTLDTAESVPLDIFGNPGAYFVQRNKLRLPRAFATGQRVGRFLYLAGGRQDGATVLDSIDRAYLLDPANRVEVTDFDVEISDLGGLAAGVYYYRVAAVMGASDPLNPGGENLSSDPMPFAVPAFSGGQVTVTLRWSAYPGAVSYRVYRTVAPNDSAGSEKLLSVVPATQLSQRDDGSVTPSGDGPLPIGSTGVWHTVGSLLVAREGPASALALDPSDSSKAYLYVLGGKSSSGAMLNSYEYLPITLGVAGAQPVGVVASGGTALGVARWQLAGYSANSLTAPQVGADQYLYMVGGLAATGASSRGEAAQVQAGGSLGSFSQLSDLNPKRAGFGHAIANGFLFAFGGVNGSPSSTSASTKIISPAPTLDNWNSTSINMSVNRYLMGSTLHGAFIYVLGGQTDTAGAAQSTEQVIW